MRLRTRPPLLTYLLTAVAGVGHGVVEVADGLVGEFMLRIPLVFLGDALLPVDVPQQQVSWCGLFAPCSGVSGGGFGGCRCGGGSPVAASHARGHGACLLGPWVVGRRQCGGVAGSRRRRRPCAWLGVGRWGPPGCAGRGLWPCDIGTRPVCRAVRASSGGVVGLGPHPLGGWGEGWGW